MNKKLYYGWVNVVILFFTYATVVAGITYAFGVVVADMSRDIGMTMAAATGAYTLYTLTHALTAPLAGRFIAKFNPKKSMLAGQALMMTGCLLMAFAGKSVFMYYLFWILFVGFGMRFGTLLPSQVVISNWFFKNRSLAMAMFLAAGGIGGYIFSPLCARVNERFSWPAVWLMIASFTAVSIVLTILFVKVGPAGGEDSAEKAVSEKKESRRAENVYKTTDSWTLSDALKTPAFYMLVFLYFASSYLVAIVSSQGINHLAIQGLDRTVAAKIVGLFALINTIGRLLVGYFGDRLDTRKLVAVGAVISAAGFLILLNASDTAQAYTALILSGIGYGVIMVGPQNLLLNYFGNHDYARINGLYSMIAGALSAAPAVIVGRLYDLNGNYRFAWILGIILFSISFIISLVIREPKLKTSEKAGKDAPPHKAGAAN